MKVESDGSGSTQHGKSADPSKIAPDSYPAKPESSAPSPAKNPKKRPCGQPAERLAKSLPWVIPCAKRGCPLNTSGRCQMVCGIKLNASGHCNMATRLARVGVFRMEASVCRGCGLPIVRRGISGKWHHVGVPLPHTAEPMPEPGSEPTQLHPPESAE